VRALRVQGNYSDLLVQLSNIYSQLRGDKSGVKNEDSAQGFVRSTTKYWVRMTDVSAVKHHILQHLPVFQYNQGSVRPCSALCSPLAFARAVQGPASNGVCMRGSVLRGFLHLPWMKLLTDLCNEQLLAGLD
jgi:hypothetical protein